MDNPLNNNYFHVTPNPDDVPLDLYFLKSSVRLEPHIWGWYAWPQSICPTTASLNIINRNIKLMESFISMPEIHKMAATNRSLMGGSFIDLDATFVPDVKRLLAEMKTNCQDLVELAHAIIECDELLRNNADGHSLEKLYSLVPDCLKGRIELVYDSNNNPSVRFIEELFYDKYYNEAQQSLILTDTVDDHRPFVLSTPRILTDRDLQLNIAFSDPKVDTLAKLRFNPIPLNEISSLFNLNEESNNKLKSMLTQTPPEKNNQNNFYKAGTRIRYFGHACVLLHTNKVSILLDPVVSYKYASDKERYTLNDLPDSIDYVLFTHIHDDHVMFETLLQLRFKVKYFVFPHNNMGFLLDPSLRLILKNMGFTNLISLGEFEKITLTDGFIAGIPFLGEHSDLNIHTKMGYIIQLHDKKYLFAADSNNLDNHLYQHIFAKFGPIDVLFIGMECVGAPLTWLYGPLLTFKIKNTHDQSRRLSGSNFLKAWDIVKLAQAREVYVYAMGQEPWLNYIMALDYTDNTTKSIQLAESDKLIQACQENGILAERLYLKKEWLF